MTGTETRKVYNMMNNNVIRKLEKLKTMDSLYYYVLAAAAIAGVYVAFCSYGYHVYQFFFALPCIMIYGALLERKAIWPCRRKLILPLMMVLWFIFMNLVHGGGGTRMYNLGLFATIYLFAFPLASLLQDGDKKLALKIFAGAYLAGAAVMTAAALLLILGGVPAFLSDVIYWAGTRLYAFWHPNLAACFWMIAVVFAAAFFAGTKSRWLKAGLAVLLVTMLAAMALTNCRTGIILTGGFLGATVFFAVVKRGGKWFIPGVLAALIILIAFVAGSGRLHQANHDALERKYVQQQIEEMKDADDAGEIRTTITNAQGSLISDLGTLNSRTRIWGAAFDAIRDNPRILFVGANNPGQYLSENGYFQIAHMHNAWMECLVGMGVPGFLLAVIFTVIALWNSLIILLKHHRDIWKRNAALLTLLLLAAGCLEPYLFYTAIDYHLFNLLFFLCVGYLVYWQEEDNRKMLAAVRDKILPAKK